MRRKIGTNGFERTLLSDIKDEALCLGQLLTDASLASHGLARIGTIQLTVRSDRTGRIGRDRWRQGIALRRLRSPPTKSALKVKSYSARAPQS